MAISQSQRAKIQALPWKEINTVCKTYGMEPARMAAVILGESGGDTYAVRYEPKWPYAKDTAKWAKAVGISEPTERICQMMSWGLMQVMGTVAREHGWKQDLSQLVEVSNGLSIGAAKFMSLMKRYKNDSLMAVSAFNAGSAKVDKNGRFSNQEYVEKHVMNYKDVDTYLHE